MPLAHSCINSYLSSHSTPQYTSTRVTYQHGTELHGTWAEIQTHRIKQSCIPINAQLTLCLSHDMWYEMVPLSKHLQDWRSLQPSSLLLPEPVYTCNTITMYGELREFSWEVFADFALFSKFEPQNFQTFCFTLSITNNDEIIPSVQENLQSQMVHFCSLFHHHRFWWPLKD